MAEDSASLSDGNYDCLIVGGGPAGLAAVIHLAGFHLSVLIIDAGKSRAALTSLTRNHAGVSGGIGTNLLVRMREPACLFGVALREDIATGLQLHLRMNDRVDTSLWVYEIGHHARPIRGRAGEEM